MIFEPFKPFVSSEFQIKYATEPFEREGAMALRRAVFCDEQGLFAGDDCDAICARTPRSAAPSTASTRTAA